MERTFAKTSPSRHKRVIAVLGDGGWGTAMAIIQTSKDHDVRLWGHDAGYVKEMAEKHENSRFLPGFKLPEGLKLMPDAALAVVDADVVILAIPTQFLRTTLERLVNDENISATLPPSAAVVSLTKGVEEKTFSRPSEVISHYLKRDDIAVLSGPSHAEEVARKLPASVVVAAPDSETARKLQDTLITPTFRIYSSTDVAGVELGGALKNVMAVAVGICEGLNLGDNARSALMARGLAEMTRMAVALGADERTFLGLSGIGDLITTCISSHGRNRAFGMEIAEGKSMDDILALRQTVAEGVHTCRSVYELARQNNIDMPITEALYSVLYEGRPPRQVVSELMNRAAKAE